VVRVVGIADAVEDVAGRDMSLKRINLETGMPTVEEARQRLQVELRNCKNSGVRVIKLIHGYGSSGVGGALKKGVLRSLALRQKEGVIQCFVAGDQWDVFNDRCRSILEACPELKRDADLNRGNPGISIILM
jgi:hypothetical protein